jgi:transcriptional regulator with XRE-family HTH domain
MKAARERRGLSFTDVAQASGLERAMIIRLENSKIHNPTLDTLDRYARVVGLRVAMRLEGPAPRPPQVGQAAEGILGPKRRRPTPWRGGPSRIAQGGIEPPTSRL